MGNGNVTVMQTDSFIPFSYISWANLKHADGLRCLCLGWVWMSVSWMTQLWKLNFEHCILSCTCRWRQLWEGFESPKTDCLFLYAFFSLTNEFCMVLQLVPVYPKHGRVVCSLVWNCKVHWNRLGCRENSKNICLYIYHFVKKHVMFCRRFTDMDPIWYKEVVSIKLCCQVIFFCEKVWEHRYSLLVKLWVQKWDDTAGPWMHAGFQCYYNCTSGRSKKTGPRSDYGDESAVASRHERFTCNSVCRPKHHPCNSEWQWADCPGWGLFPLSFDLQKAHQNHIYLR